MWCHTYRRTDDHVDRNACFPKLKKKYRGCSTLDGKRFLYFMTRTSHVQSMAEIIMDISMTFPFLMTIIHINLNQFFSPFVVKSHLLKRISFVYAQTLWKNARKYGNGRFTESRYN